MVFSKMAIIDHYDDDVQTAFNNFFFDYCDRRKNGEDIQWSEEYWKSWGVDVLDSKIVFYTAKHKTLFMLRWR